MEIVQFEFKNFPGPAAGEGRTSVQGTLKSREDRFLEMKDRIFGSLVSAGVPRLTANDLLGSNPKRKPYKMFYPAGTVYAFSVEAKYRETVSGFDFKYTSTNFGELKGVPRSQLGETSYIIGTAEETKIFNDLLGIYKDRLKRKEEEKKERVEAKAKAAATADREQAALLLGKGVGKFEIISAKKGERIGPVNMWNDRCLIWTIYGSADIFSRPDYTSEPVKAKLRTGSYNIERWGHPGPASQVFFVATSRVMKVELWRKKGQACK